MEGTPEPTKETYAAVGHLCVAWSYVEMLSEQTLWGILSLNREQGEAFIWRMPLLQRWQVIVREAKKKFNESEIKELLKIKHLVETVQRDRNIVVHGIVHASIALANPISKYDRIAGIGDPIQFSRPPCWTIYIGEDAGKNFQVSTEAVLIIKENAEKVQELIRSYNINKGFTAGTVPNDNIEPNWPKRI
ncbi:hypothetical protein [Nitrospirillum amazonense]|uniref:hypothetical protein n=1 Tax=Nitrospirillum amazonense TaxID=28077 RepID=UPI00119F2069|nr:hypothetical protein [Nitrospirillum amazonense]